MDAVALTAVPRATRSVALALALLTVLFALHASICAACSTPRGDRLARMATSDLWAVRIQGAPGSRAACGAGSMAAHDASEIAPFRACEPHRLADIESRNTTLARNRSPNLVPQNQDAPS